MPTRIPATGSELIDQLVVTEPAEARPQLVDNTESWPDTGSVTDEVVSEVSPAGGVTVAEWLPPARAATIRSG